MHQKDQIPTYDQAITALETGNGEVLEEAVFALEIDDGYYIEQVTKAVRSLLERPGLTPRQIVTIGRTLHGLGRLPLRTPGLDIHLALVDELNGEATSYELFLSSDSFATESGGYMNAGFGTDSFSSITFEVGPGFRQYTGFHISQERWPDVFNEMKVAELQVEDESNDSLLDWDHSDGSEFWQWIADHD